MVTILAIIIFLFGILIGVYAMSIPAIFAGQYMILSVILIAIGVFLFVYARRKKSKKSD